MSQELMQAVEIHAKLFGLTKSEAREDAEALIKGMMENEGYTREFAEATFIEDTMDTDPEALAKLEAQAKANAKEHRAKRAPADYSLEGKPKRARKPNEEKREIINQLFEAMPNLFGLDHAIANPEREITFTQYGKHYSLTLTCHREPKAGKA